MKKDLPQSSLSWAAPIPGKSAFLLPSFRADLGVILEGTLPVPADDSDARCGLYIEGDQAQGTGILLGPKGVTEIGALSWPDLDFIAEKRVDREWPFGLEAHFRLLFRGPLLEFYLDDLLMECYSMPSRATGRLGLIQGESPIRLDPWRAWGYVSALGEPMRDD
jgi:hypothetical protein